MAVERSQSSHRNNHFRNIYIYFLKWIFVWFDHHRKKPTLKSSSPATCPGLCTFSDCWHLIKMMWYQKETPSLSLENTWQTGSFHRGWIYDFILTWLILDAEVLLQEAACLIMARVRANMMPEAGTTVTPKRLWRGDVIVTEVSVTPPIEKLPELPGFFNIERPTAAVDPLLTNTVGSGFNRELTREVFRPFSSRQGYAFLSLSHNDTGDLTVDNCSMSTFVVLLRADADSSPTPTPPLTPSSPHLYKNFMDSWRPPTFACSSYISAQTSESLLAGPGRKSSCPSGAERALLCPIFSCYL